MRGPDMQKDTLFSTVRPELRVPKDHPLRPIRTMVDAALSELDAGFNAIYSPSLVVSTCPGISCYVPSC